MDVGSFLHYTLRGFLAAIKQRGWIDTDKQNDYRSTTSGFLVKNTRKLLLNYRLIRVNEIQAEMFSGPV